MRHSYVPRTLASFAQTASTHFPVLLVTGARQVGKTTFLQHLSEAGRTYVSLDDPTILELARQDPALFFQRFEPPLLIDEIQYAPQLLPHIKLHVDRTQQPGAFWLTGSQQFHLMQGVSESLAGRVAILQLLGLSRRELRRQSELATPFLPTPEQVKAREAAGGVLALPELYRLIWRGSLPAIALDPELDRDLFYGSYVQTYLQRDVRDLARVGDEAAFLRFLRASAARTGQLLNVTQLSRDADVAVNTAKAWLSILQTSGLIYLLQPYHNNLTKRLVKTPKLYFLDTGLCAYLTQWTTPEALEAGAMAGAMLETWVITEILKSYWHNGKQAPFYYYHDHDQKEIDLLIVQDDRLYPLEVKKTASPRAEDTRLFQSLKRFGHPVGEGGLICLTPLSLPLTQEAWAIGVGAL